MPHFRVYVNKNPRHARVRVFVGDGEETTHELAGTLVFEPDEWDVLMDRFRPIILDPANDIDLIEEGDHP